MVGSGHQTCNWGMCVSCAPQSDDVLVVEVYEEQIQLLSTIGEGVLELLVC